MNRACLCCCYAPATAAYVRPTIIRDDNGSAGHGSSVSTNLSGSRVSTHDPLTQRQFNSVVSTDYFVAVMIFDFESTST